MRERQRKTCQVGDALHLALGSAEATQELAIARLWRHWSEILGPDMAELVHPLGRRKTTMLLGATNSMVMQEFSYFGDHILHKANDFLGVAFFQQIHLELMAGRPALDQSLLPVPQPRSAPRRPDPLGNLLPCMDPSSPVTRCYHAYVRHFCPELITPENV